jgi:hypothetical protein
MAAPAVYRTRRDVRTATRGNESTPAANPRAPLAELVERGERLARSASMVGDQDDFHVWRASRNEWVDATLLDLKHRRSPVLAKTFLAAVCATHPRSRWQIVLPEEVACVEQGVAVLRTFAHSSASDAATLAEC